jgi:hypothetical protein
LVQRQRLQLILDLRLQPHPLLPVHQQLPHIAFLRRRHPDPRKPPLLQQPQQMRRVPPVRLLPAYVAGPNLRRISDPQLVPALG